ncbi:MAG: hypothetical protein AABO41_02795 [Acidobacteriota bacterium]
MNQLRKYIIVSLFVALLAFSPSALAQADMFDGRPAFSEGAELGYYIWREGDKWKLRWTTMGPQRKFTGSVVATGGELHDLKRIDVEEERRVLYPGRAPNVWVGPRGRTHVGGGRAPVVVERKQDHIKKDGDHTIVFNALTGNDIDGFDFKPDKKVTALRFVLEINGRPMPMRVEIGKDNKKAPALPLEVRIR